MNQCVVRGDRPQLPDILIKEQEMDPLGVFMKEQEAQRSMVTNVDTDSGKSVENFMKEQ